MSPATACAPRTQMLLLGSESNRTISTRDKRYVAWLTLKWFCWTLTPTGALRCIAQSGHQAQQSVLRRLLARDFPDEPASTEHDDARRQRQDLRQLARDEQDRAPARSELADERMNLGLGADVHAAR